jgi:hypothetical protein
MKEYNWSRELEGVFRQVEVVTEDVKQNLTAVYVRRGLAWDNQVMRNLSGDIHTKCLGAYIQNMLRENGIETDVSYEVKLPPTMLRADILINKKIDIESKAQGIFSLKDLKDRWSRLNQNRPDLTHVLVSWHHNPSYVRQIREFIPEPQHYYFHNLLTNENQPRELERLVRNILNWLGKR